MGEVLGIGDITYAVNKVLKDNFPNVSRESDENVEGFNLPSFFVYIKNLNFSHESEYYKRSRLLVNINYFSKSGKEIENIEMTDALRDAFGITLKVKDRVLKIYDIGDSKVESSYTSGILQFNFKLDFISFIHRNEEAALIGKVEVGMNNEIEKKERNYGERNRLTSNTARFRPE